MPQVVVPIDEYLAEVADDGLVLLLEGPAGGGDGVLVRHAESNLLVEEAVLQAQRQLLVVVGLLFDSGGDGGVGGEVHDEVGEFGHRDGIVDGNDELLVEAHPQHNLRLHCLNFADYLPQLGTATVKGIATIITVIIITTIIVSIIIVASVVAVASIIVCMSLIAYGLIGLAGGVVGCTVVS